MQFAVPQSLFFNHNVRQGIIIHSLLHISIDQMRVYLGGIKLLVSKYVLKNSHVNLATLVHQRCGRVTKLVDGKSL